MMRNGRVRNIQSPLRRGLIAEILPELPLFGQSVLADYGPSLSRGICQTASINIKYDPILRGRALTSTGASVNNYSDMGTPSLAWSVPMPMTIAVLFYQNTTFSDYAGIFSSQKSATQTGGYVVNGMANGKVRLTVYNNTGGVWVYAESDAAITYNSPTVVVGTVDAAGNINLYVNGVLQAGTASVSAIRYVAGLNARVGYYGSSGGLKGGLSYVRIWNRLLTPNEISVLKPNDPTDGGLLITPRRTHKLYNYGVAGENIGTLSGVIGTLSLAAIGHLGPDDTAWLPGYMYRKRVPINASDDGVLTNHRTRINLFRTPSTSTAGNVGLNNGPAAWPNDIRITTGDGQTLCDFWRQRYDADDGIWIVEIPSIAATGKTYIYVYYGKANDTDASSGSDTFIEFGDFSAGTTPASLQAVGTPTVAASSMLEPKASVIISEDLTYYETNPCLAIFSDGDQIISWAYRLENHHSGPVTYMIGKAKRSTDNGKTWSEAFDIHNEEASYHSAVAGLAVYMNGETETLMAIVSRIDGGYSNLYSKTSTDKGANWSGLATIKAGSYNRYISGELVVLSNGVILFPCYDVNGKVYVERYASGSWSEITAADNSTYDPDEASIVELKDGNGDFTGDVYIMMRTEYSGYPLYKCLSDDYGATWGSWGAVSGLISPERSKPPNLCRMSDDTILCVLNYSTILYLYKSTDECGSFSLIGPLITGELDDSGSSGEYEISFYAKILETALGDLAVAWISNSLNYSDVYYNLFAWPPVACASVSVNATEYLEGVASITPPAILECCTQDIAAAPTARPFWFGFGYYHGTTYDTNGVARGDFGGYLSSGIVANDGDGRGLGTGIKCGGGPGIWKIEWYAGNAKLYHSSSPQAAALHSSTVDYVPTADLPVTFGTTTTYANASAANLLWFFVRDFVADEPAWDASGIEQESIIGTLSKPISVLSVSSAGSLSISGTLTAPVGVLSAAAVGSLSIVGSLSKPISVLSLASVGSLAITGALSKPVSVISVSAVGSLPIAGALSGTIATLSLAATGYITTPGAGMGTLDLMLGFYNELAEPVSGELSQPISVLSLSSTGSLEIAGVLSAPISVLSAVSAGSLPISGLTSGNISDLSIVAIGSLPISGDLSTLVSALSIVSESSLAILGSLSAPVSVLSLASVGSLDIPGALSAPISVLSIVSVGALPLEGSLSGSISTLSLSSTGAADLSGSLSSSIGILSLASTGSLAIEGVASAGFVLTSEAIGSIAISGATDGSFLLSLLSSGSLAIQGELSQSIGALSLASTGGSDATGSLSSAIGTLSLISEGSLEISGATAGSIGALSLESVGSLSIVGSASAGLVLDLEATGSLSTIGVLTAPISALCIVASGSSINTGQVTGSIGALSLVSVGSLSTQGITSANIASLTLAGTGSLAISGAASGSLALAISAAGSLAISGQVSAPISSLSLAATGTSDVSGSLSSAIGSLTLAATGIMPLAGVASGPIGSISLATIGSLQITGQLSKPISVLSLVASGSVDAIIGQLSGAIGVLTVESEGRIDIVGTVNVEVSRLTSQAVGSLSITGSLSKPIGILSVVSAEGNIAYFLISARIDSLMTQNARIDSNMTQVARI